MFCCRLLSSVLSILEDWNLPIRRLECIVCSGTEEVDDNSWPQMTRRYTPCSVTIRAMSNSQFSNLQKQSLCYKIIHYYNARLKCCQCWVDEKYWLLCMVVFYGTSSYFHSSPYIPSILNYLLKTAWDFEAIHVGFLMSDDTDDLSVTSGLWRIKFHFRWHMDSHSHSGQEGFHLCYRNQLCSVSQGQLRAPSPLSFLNKSNLQNVE